MGEPHRDHPLDQARAILNAHSILAPLALRVRVNRQPGNPCPRDNWAVVAPNGRIHVNPNRTGTVEEWTQILAHLFLHLGLGHVRKREHPTAWNAACDMVVGRVLGRLGFLPVTESDRCKQSDDLDEEGLYRKFCAEGIPKGVTMGTGGSGPDMLVDGSAADTPNWTYLLSKGLRQGMEVALRRSASGARYGRPVHESPAQQARSWFMREYPLLGALASAFTIVEDASICRRYGIAIAAVQPAVREIYVNPGAGLDADEGRFVVAHELLHVGLLHHRRRAWRHPFFWNIACDYIVNGWLLEMGVGTMPAFRGHHDFQLHGLSAEVVYARIASRPDDFRSCGTFRGVGVGDMLADDDDEAGIELDEFLRRCLVNGLEQQYRRGRWFDAHLAPLTLRRSYARPSRRQSATPNTPRPRVVPVDTDTRTFGVVLDTSASMDRAVLAAALGSVAGYALSREVGTVRLVFCDAEPYDRGYVAPEALVSWVDIRGRGGTVLQGAIDLLEEARDFPAACPILVVTDGLCDELSADREHAFLVPPGHSLPFVSTAPVFAME